MAVVSAVFVELLPVWCACSAPSAVVVLLPVLVHPVPAEVVVPDPVVVLLATVVIPLAAVVVLLVVPVE
jgi:hypothetical protein